MDRQQIIKNQEKALKMIIEAGKLLRETGAKVELRMDARPEVLNPPQDHPGMPVGYRTPNYIQEVQIQVSKVCGW